MDSPVGERLDVSLTSGPKTTPVGATDLHGTVTLAMVIPPESVRMFVMADGNVDFFNDTGGYGFIETEDADEDVFFHMEDVGGPDLEEGTDVEFEIEQADKGPRATNVVRT